MTSNEKKDWFVKRFKATVFENELKWYATENLPGEVNYTLADEMLKLAKANQIISERALVRKAAASELWMK